MDVKLVELTKNKLINKLVAFVLTLVLTMIDFMPLGTELVSYAANSLETATNNKNVVFDCYFKDENGTELTEKGEKINSDSIKLFIKLSVKKDGYFNGKVSIENSNFSFKNEILSSAINKIENNTITFNQINSDETVEAEIGIEPIKNDTINSEFLNMESIIAIDGIYRNIKEKDINISAKRNVRLILENPYEENEGAEISTQLITNKVYNIAEGTKRIVQVLIESGLKDNAYPVRENNIEINVPNGVERVNVISRGKMATNGKNETEFNTNNWEYLKDEQKIKILIKNEDENAKWLKDGKDDIIVTYIMDEKAEVQNEELTAKSTITMYDINKTFKEATSTVIITEEKDGVITSGVEVEEKSIYKGKIYSGEDRNYKVKTYIYVNNAETEKNAVIDLLPTTFETTTGETPANVKLANTKINKEEVLRILGENGNLRILTLDGNLISEVNNNTETDDNGNIIVSYPEEISAIKIETSDALSDGTIVLEHTKTIKQDGNTRNTKATYIGLKERVAGIEEAKIELKETITLAELKINKSSLSTMVENTGVEITAILKNNSEENDLFKNPSLKIVLPSQVENVNINSVNLLYDDELQISSHNVYDENGAKVIEINLTGEQTKYSQGNVEGTTIIINANLNLNRRATNSNETVKMIYTNQNSGTTTMAEKQLEIISPRGMVTVNSINDYGMSVIGEEDTKTSKLELGGSAKESKVDIEVINNNEEVINNVKILGDFPTKNDKNTIDTQVSGIEINGANANIYYSENANATEDLENNSNGWRKEITNNSEVKKYLITVDSMEQSQGLTASYKLNIPEGLQYNEETYEGYKVLYSNRNTTSEVKATTLGLATGKGPELKATMKTKLGNKELSSGEDVKQGEFLKYEIIIENIGSETATDINISSKVPEGTIYVEPKENFIYEDGYFNELVDVKDITFNIESLAAGERITKAYEIKVTKNAQENSEIENKAIVKYGEATIESNSMKNKVAQGNLNVVVKRATDLGTNSYRGEFIEYFIIVENISNKIQKDVSVDINLPEELELINVELITDDDNEKLETTKNIKVGDIDANNKKIICIQTEIGTVKDDDVKEVSISAMAKSKDSKGTISNEYVESIKNILLTISLSSDKENAYIKTGDTVEYTIKIQNNSSVDSKDVDILDEIPEQLTIQSFVVDGQEQEIDDGKSVLLIQNVKANSSIEAKLKTIVNYDETRTEPTSITNVAKIYDGEEVLSTSEEIMHILQAEEIKDDQEDQETAEISENTDIPENSENSYNKQNNELISGIVWLDENQNGQRDSNEKLLDGINVRLLDKSGNIVKTENGQNVVATTNNKGLYLLSNLPQGDYFVIFDYDTSMYATTAYKKAGVADNRNSDAILKQITIDGEQKTLGVTDTIALRENGVSNIDLGLMTATKFDLELNKYISKIIVRTNKETKTYNYDKSTLAKAEIAAKQLQGATVIIEYQIEVKNVGEVSGYVKKIADYMPSNLNFSSELNKNWYQTGNSLYNESLANSRLEAGETKIIPLTLTKAMTEENTGLVNNKAEIAESYNEAGIQDIDSTAGNKIQGEDDMGSADVIISVKTGAMITYVSLTVTIIMIIGLGAYLLKRKIDNENNIEVNF